MRGGVAQAALSETSECHVEEIEMPGFGTVF